VGKPKAGLNEVGVESMMTCLTPQNAMRAKHEFSSRSTCRPVAFRNRLSVIAVVIAFAGHFDARAAEQAWAEKREIWFTKPAAEWKLGLPVGNGRLGAMVQGIWPRERIQLNEDSIWAKEPLLRHPATTKDRIAEAQKLVDAGKYKQAHELFASQIIMGDAPGIGSYQTMGDLWIENAGAAQPEALGYRRSLDVATGLVTVTQPMSDGSVITEEVISSAVDDCIVVRISTTAVNGLALDVSMTHPVKTIRPVVKGADTLLFEGQAQYVKGKDPYLGTKFSTVLKVLPEGGTVTGAGGMLQVRAAKAVTLLLCCSTDFNKAQPQEPLADGWQKKAADTLAKAQAKPWERIKRDSMADIAALMHRCDVDLGKSAPELRTLPNDERLARFKGTQSDPDMMELYFQFGRYLLVASSRPGSLPINLQGIWADQLINPWNSDYHLNINMQMNYWPVHTTGLSECHGPLFWLLDMLRVEGRRMAASYGAKGFCTPHGLNVWGRTINDARNPRHGGSVISAAWMAMDVMEHHRFTGDAAFLRKTGWPILKESCEFVQSWVIRDHKTGKWVPRASCSHEIGFHYTDENGQKQHSEIGPVTAYDQSIIWQIMTDCLEAASILGIEDDFTKLVRKTLSELEFPRVGRDGTILEWGIEDVVEADVTHRHLSHLIGFHPGSQISRRKTPELYEAVKNSLVKRGIGGAGWAMAWRSIQYARHADGETALTALDALAARPSPNFFGDNRCQLDQNFGLTSAVVEMLLQSHDDAVELLPALPKAWKMGSAKGLVARGGFVVDMEWKDGKLTQAVILSRLGGPLAVRHGGKIRSHTTQKGERIVMTFPQ
jgi:alpha-L-fucosidase 2